MQPRNSFRIQPKLLTAWHPGISTSPVRHVPLPPGTLQTVPGGQLPGKATRAYPAVHLAIFHGDFPKLLLEVQEALGAFASLSSLSLSPSRATPKRYLHVVIAQVAFHSTACTAHFLNEKVVVQTGAKLEKVFAMFVPSIPRWSLRGAISLLGRHCWRPPHCGAAWLLPSMTVGFPTLWQCPAPGAFHA